MLQPMFANAIQEDSIISALKKVPKTTTKPRTVSFQEGGDDVTTKTKAIVWRQKNILPTPESNQEHFIPKQHILIGSILIQIPSLQEKVEPNFRTPPKKKIATCIASPKKVT